ncbi:hypothetical protein DSL72_005374 [Monilinia vaccinii-corymbosi]|uniref:Uncharacterized protein n=1 Tax=Monilinia vaccinii-corymbosi TaxID=61207 RepID=A0A8A3PF01_9HELO|nr:hypothetical protein DSL72_005374 [Monilinia vaccinii-corymbosi]
MPLLRRKRKISAPTNPHSSNFMCEEPTSYEQQFVPNVHGGHQATRSANRPQPAHYQNELSRENQRSSKTTSAPTIDHSATYVFPATTLNSSGKWTQSSRPRLSLKRPDTISEDSCSSNTCSELSQTPSPQPQPRRLDLNAISDWASQVPPGTPRESLQDFGPKNRQEEISTSTSRQEAPARSGTSSRSRGRPRDENGLFITGYDRS